MKAYVLIETAAGKTKQVKKTLAKVKSPRSSVSAMDAVTGPYDFIAVVEGQTLDAIGSLVTDAIGIIDVSHQPPWASSEKAFRSSSVMGRPSAASKRGT